MTKRNTHISHIGERVKREWIRFNHYIYFVSKHHISHLPVIGHNHKRMFKVSRRNDVVELNILPFQIGSECLACREKAAVFDMSYFGKYYLFGPDAAKAVDWIFSNDLRKDAGTQRLCCKKRTKVIVQAIGVTIGQFMIKAWKLARVYLRIY